MRLVDVVHEYDNTMLNSIKLICEDRTIIRPDEEGWTVRDIHENAVFCPENTYLNGFQLKVQPPQGKGKEFDDTATNDVIMFCNGQEVKSKNYNETNFGNWSSVQMCPENQFIRGITLQIEKYDRDSLSDNTGLNNVRMSCS